MARRRRLAPKFVVSNGMYVSCLFVEKIALVERRKVVERDPTCCGKFPYKLLINRDVAFA
jgi:hypothetical protein